MASAPAAMAMRVRRRDMVVVLSGVGTCPRECRGATPFPEATQGVDQATPEVLPTPTLGLLLAPSARPYLGSTHQSARRITCSPLQSPLASAASPQGSWPP